MRYVRILKVRFTYIIISCESHCKFQVLAHVCCANIFYCSLKSICNTGFHSFQSLSKTGFDFCKGCPPSSIIRWKYCPFIEIIKYSPSDFISTLNCHYIFALYQSGGLMSLSTVGRRGDIPEQASVTLTCCFTLDWNPQPQGGEPNN